MQTIQNKVLKLSILHKRCRVVSFWCVAVVVFGGGVGSVVAVLGSVVVVGCWVVSVVGCGAFVS